MIKKLNEIFESVIDFTRETLDQDLFNNEEPKEELLDYFADVINEIDRDFVPIVGRSLIKGSILSYQWLPHSDIDLLVEIPADITDTQYKIIKHRVKNRFNGVKVLGTRHPLQIYLNRGTYNDDNADGIYDLSAGWVKGPYSLVADIKKYEDEFNSIVSQIDLNIGELRRDLIDLDILKNLPEDEIKGIKALTNKKIYEIENDINSLLDKGKFIKNNRHNIFNRDMTSDEIKKYGSKNLLPYNVVSKMLERYHYLNIIDKIDDYGDDDKISLDELDEISSMLLVKMEDDDED